MPVHNSALYVEKSIHSLLQQTYRDFEFVIIDDGSTDGTLDIIKRINDSRIKVTVHQNNIGLVASLNEGLSLCSGEYIARMDGDDIALLHRLERQVAFMDANPHIGVCGGQAQFMNSLGIPSNITTKPLCHEAIKSWQLFHCTFVHPTVMYRKSVLDGNGIRYLPYAHAEDYEIWNRLAEVTRLANLPEVLLHYRVHTGQVSSMYQHVQEESAERIRRNQFGRIGLDPTYEEYQTHLDFCHFRIRIHDHERYTRSLAWAHQLLEANLRTQIYDHHTLNTVLSQCFSWSR